MLCLSVVVLLSGCVVRTYQVTKDRVDQDLNTGNRGYLKGQAPLKEVKERKTTRTTQVVEIELHSPIKFEKMPKAKPVEEKMSLKKTADEEIWGNRGYISESRTPEIAEPEITLTGQAMEKYTVQKGDTLQKISKEFYGTTKRWTKIYETNKGVLKSPDKVYPGQVINIPVEPQKETLENLK